jgi:hypothetical protein
MRGSPLSEKSANVSQTRDNDIIEACICKFESKNDGFGRSAIYSILVRDSSRRFWTVQKRFKDFYELHKQLVKQHPNEDIPFPSYSFYNNYIDFGNNERACALNIFLSYVVDRRLNMQILQEFLCSADENKQKDSIKHGFDWIKLYSKALNIKQRISCLVSKYKGQLKRGSVDTIETPTVSPSESCESLFSTVQVNLPKEDSLMYTPLKVLGKGNFGMVYLAKDRSTGSYCAVKCIKKGEIGELATFLNEQAILKECRDHPFFVNMINSFQTDRHLYIVLEYASGGDIFYHLQREKRFSEMRTRFYAAEIVAAIGSLHKKNIIYRDLKPENLLLDELGHILIGDFGLAKKNVDYFHRTGTFCGTIEYLGKN